MTHQTVKLRNFESCLLHCLYLLLDDKEIFSMCVQPEACNLTI